MGYSSQQYMHRAIRTMLEKEQQWEQKLLRAHSNAKRSVTLANKKGEALVEETRNKAQATAKAHKDAVARSTQASIQEIQEDAQRRIEHIEAFSAQEITKELQLNL